MRGGVISAIASLVHYTKSHTHDLDFRFMYQTRKIAIYITDKRTGEIYSRYQEIVTFDGVCDTKRLDAFFRGFKRVLSDLKHPSVSIMMESDPYSPPRPRSLF